MSEEFLDFLKQKCAYVAVGEFKPGKFNEAKQLYEKAVATYGNGFQGSYLLQQPGTDKGIAIIFWDSVENMSENENEAYQTILKELNPLFANPPVTGVYDLVDHTHSV